MALTAGPGMPLFPVPTKVTKEDAEGLQLADEKIDGIISQIQEELKKLSPKKFETEGYIAPASFGGGDRAPGLGLHHGRAHAVVAETLRGVIQDLENFQQACRDARKYILEADQGAADDLGSTRLAVDSLVVGSWTNEGQGSYDDARNRRPDPVAPEEEGDA